MKKKVGHIKAVIFSPLLVFLEKKIEIPLLCKDVPCFISLGLEKRGFWEVRFISFLHFFSLVSMCSLKTTLLRPSSISPELFSSRVCEVVTLCVPTGSAQNLSQMPLRRRWEASSFSGRGEGRVFRLTGRYAGRRRKREPRSLPEPIIQWGGRAQPGRFVA